MKREEMIAVIEGGGSVLHDGRLHTRIETLPSKASLAQSETERAAAAGDLDAQIAVLQKQRDALSGKVPAKDSKENSGNSTGGLPEDFPMAQVFTKHGFKSVTEVQGKSREDLIALDGIGEASADKALVYGK